jgi:asparagine synthetase A
VKEVMKAKSVKMKSITKSKEIEISMAKWRKWQRIEAALSRNNGVIIK